MSDIHQAVSALFEPIDLGPLHLKNRIAMAPMASLLHHWSRIYNHQQAWRF